jgi:DNA repair protein SbcD/Mre11
MRLLHISDWHLGVTHGRLSRASDHEEVLDEELAIARDLRPHLIVHTGDLFDQSRPAVEDLRRGFAYLQELADVAPLVVLAGNHDSPALFEVFNLLLAFGAVGGESRLRFIPRARMASDGGILRFAGEDRGGIEEEIRLAPIPFVPQNSLIDVFGTRPEQWTASYADQIALLEENLAAGLAAVYDASRHINVFAAHLFVDGAELCKSERTLHVSDSYATRPEQLPRVSYAAFGHIHRPQPIRGLERARYAGSPIQIDYGEEGETKTVVFVEAEPGRTAKVDAIPLSGGRPLRRVEGTLEQLDARRDEVGRSILTAIVHSEDAIPDLSDRLAVMFPDATLLEAYNPYESGRVAIVSAAADGQAEPSVEELFASYLASVQPNLKGARAVRVREIFTTLLSTTEDGAAAEFAEACLFDDDIAAPSAALESNA